MIKTTNVLACFLVALFMAGIATGEIDQEIFRKSGLIVAWVISGWFAAIGLVNLRRQG